MRVIVPANAVDTFDIPVEVARDLGVSPVPVREAVRRLEAEGLFARERKRALPYLPSVIGVVTSPTGAVIRDILHRLGQTALLGGLMQSNFTMSKRRLPVLGAIPIIGELFGSTVSEDEKTDLLLIVTSQVID